MTHDKETAAKLDQLNKIADPIGHRFEIVDRKVRHVIDVTRHLERYWPSPSPSGPSK